jgi:pimeloyl-ACP methyl ester carboxylesterase
MTPAEFHLQSLPLPTGEAMVFDTGAGPPVVFIHGYPGLPQDFRWLVPQLPYSG